MVNVGVDSHVAPAWAERFRERYVDPASWLVFPDSEAALRLTAAHGWCNVILSNHVPELPALVRALGLAENVTLVLTSAAHGFEKPHPGAFRLALRAAGASAELSWMVGDNPIADIAGAAQLGIRGVLVRVGEFDAAVTSRLETSYGASHFPGWQELCAVRAGTALEAAELIVSDPAQNP